MASTQGFSKEAESRYRNLVDDNLRFLQPDEAPGKMVSWFASTFKNPLKSRNSANVGFFQTSQHNDTHFEANGNPDISQRLNSSLGSAQGTKVSSCHNVEPSSSGANFQTHHSNLDRFQQANSGTKIQQRHEDFATLTPEIAVSDQTCSSQRMGSTTSKSSEMSSHTTFDPPLIKAETEEGGDVIHTLKALTPSSSLSSQLSPLRSSTPASLRPPMQEQPVKSRKDGSKTRPISFADLRPKTSIPMNISSSELAQQSIHAAYSSRLNPYALHPGEYNLLREYICKSHVTAYLNVRNRILRLWVRNPLVCVTAEEAAGCALSHKWLNLAEVAYEWLVRKGYINFGCVEVPDVSNAMDKKPRARKAKRKTVVVVGAGMAGIGCARQLEGLFKQYHQRLVPAGAELPQVIILEGRNRIGGRVYSHPLKNQISPTLPEGSRCTAEMGGHIITGFDHGNPLSMIIRGQLALRYYPLKDNSTIFDIDGRVVDKERDSMVEKLYNDILDRASVYRHRTLPPITCEGDRTLIEAGRDPTGDSDAPISEKEHERISEATRAGHSQVENVPGGVDKLTGKAHMITGSRKKAPPAVAAEAMGWHLASNVLAYQDLNLDAVARSSDYPTLGAAMDEAVKQYQFLLDLSPQDMRLINWHYANLEYANAINLGKLSLSGWDQDAGNEFEGEHAQIIGGYQQVPRGLWQYPSKIDLRTKKAVTKIKYNVNGLSENTTRLFCDDGEVLEADQIVLAVPLGVLQSNSITFDPLLPQWKTDPIRRLGFGTLNKVILVYHKPFWDVDQDMFGLLREPEVKNSLDQEDYVTNRGKFYLFWNCIKTSGQPVLIALMAGDAAHQAETASDAEIVAGVTQELALIFKQIPIPMPAESIVTRWGNDRFARGTYSYVGATSLPGDYDLMAGPVGNLHFAGEATCGTHPATVHGAYISGLRAASEIIDDMLGAIDVPTPLVPASTKVDSLSPRQSTQKRKAEDAGRNETEAAKQARLESVESDILKAIFNELGYRPSKPGKPGSNPYLLYSKDKWAECKERCDEARRVATGNPRAKADRNQIRAAVGQMWREASDEAKRPYNEKTSSNRQANSEYAANFDEYLATWDEKAIEVRRKYVEAHPEALSAEEEQKMWQALGVHEPARRGNQVSRDADDSGSMESIDGR